MLNSSCEARVRIAHPVAGEALRRWIVCKIGDGVVTGPHFEF